MSEVGQSRRFGCRPVTSGLPRSADIRSVRRHVTNGPWTDIGHAKMRSGDADKAKPNSK